MKRIKGLIVAPFTAFKNDGFVDLQKVKEQEDFYRRNGAAGAFVCGTTGEGSALTMQEKKSLFKEWGRVKHDGFTVIGFLGGTCLEEEKELAKYAVECGLDAVAVTAPYYQKPADVDTLSMCCAEVAAAASEIPFFYYHIPCLTNVGFPMSSLLEKMDAEIPNLAGIKYTFEDLSDYQLCLEFKERKYNILWGRDEMLLPALSIGASGFVGSTYGYCSRGNNMIIEKFNSGQIEEAAKLQLTSNRLITLLGKYGSGSGKAFMKAAGLDLGPCRLPLQTMSRETYISFTEELKRLDFDSMKNQ